MKTIITSIAFILAAAFFFWCCLQLPSSAHIWQHGDVFGYTVITLTSAFYAVLPAMVVNILTRYFFK